METKEVKIDLNGFQLIQDYMMIKGVTHRTVYNWINSGKVDVKKILGRTLVREKK